MTYMFTCPLYSNQEEYWFTNHDSKTTSREIRLEVYIFCTLKLVAPILIQTYSVVQTMPPYIRCNSHLGYKNCSTTFMML